MMSRNRMLVVSQIAAPLLAAVMILASAGGAQAGLGDARTAVDIPAGAQCGGTGGTAVTMVPGGKAGFPKITALLVTSCVTGTQAQLFFLQPQSFPFPGPATLVKTINTTVTPSGGWRALGFRADQGDLIACGVVSGTTQVYSIAFSPFNATPAPGTATLLRSSPATATCAGIAWDPQTKTIYQSSSTANVLHFPATGTGTGTPIPSVCGAGVAGIGIAGKSLFVSCQSD
jgi:hypothetical protein